MAITTTQFKVILALAPVALPAAYLIYLKRAYAKHTTATASISPPDPPPSDITPLCEDIPAPEHHVIARERVLSHPLPITALRPSFRDLGSGLLEAYLRTTMQSFSWTPQAFMMSRMIQDPVAKRTFTADFLRGCHFEVGDRVCGVYVVSARADGMVVLRLQEPEGWKGPIVHGALVVGFERVPADQKGDDGERRDKVRFVNETILWRRKDEKKVFLETAMGRWFHTLMVGALVTKGMRAVMSE